MLTTLDALLLFLVGHKSQSGYDIRQLFQATPLGMFSDSPGSIYPSLARLEERGLLKSSAAAEGRRRRSYKRTREGEMVFLAWLAAPIEPDDAKRRAGEIELRFVMTAEALGWRKALAFLEEADAVFTAQLKRLETFMAGPGAAMNWASRGTVDLGMRTVRLQIQWCRDMRKTKGKDRQ